ncbi:hypothetical protein EVAR_101379_1 [Eumeta japonica]|uniref:Uncharacterized protein n=1 Tax=Eumeta variegata TaxID=151549 RepID=A0A4C1SI92_EUMVA|nr:hypothetical protein EVAR_101379_1 [Eumeta japonica]
MIEASKTVTSGDPQGTKEYHGSRKGTAFPYTPTNAAQQPKTTQPRNLLKERYNNQCVLMSNNTTALVNPVLDHRLLSSNNCMTQLRNVSPLIIMRIDTTLIPYATSYTGKTIGSGHSHSV